MNPQFRYVKLKFNDLRKLTSSTVTALKQQEKVSLKPHRNRAVCLHGSDIILNKSTQEVSQPESRSEPRFFCKQRPDSQNIYNNDSLRQKIILRHFDKPYDFKKKTRNSCKKIQRDINERNEFGNVIFGANYSNVQIDTSKLQFNKSTNYTQKENLITKEDKELPERKYQNSSGEKKSSQDPEDENKPTYAQLQRVAKYYEEQIFAMHARTEEFSQGLHHKDIIFENNYTRIPASCQGLLNYQMALAKMRILGNISYFTYRFEPISIRCDMDEGAVILHWRLFYINNLRFFTKSAPRVLIDRSFKNMYDEDDAISTFYVNGEGKIVKHKVDKTIPVVQKSKKTLTLAEKLKKKLNLAVT